MFSFGDEDDEKFIQSIQPLPKQAIERAVFTAPDFDPDSFLSSRRHLGLERLKMELNSHLRLLKNELVELINQDYQDFINLSTNLKGVDRSMDSLQIPLIRMESQVKDLKSHFQGTIENLENQLEKRGHVQEKKTCLKLLLNIHESVSKVEDLLEINADIAKEKQSISNKDVTKVTTSESQTNVSINQPELDIGENLGKQIERVAVEYNQMQHLVNRGKHLAFVNENEWRINRIKDTLQHKLSKALSIALNKMMENQLNNSIKQSMIQCLRTYALVDQTHIAEKIIREEYIRVFLDKTITREAIESPRSMTSPTLTPSPSSSSILSDHYPLVIMYNKILLFATNDLRPILEITQQLLKGTNYEILVNSLWTEFVDQINKKCSSIYAPGQTEVCHKNYTASIHFMAGLENLFTSKKSLLYFRNHPSYNEFMKRWQLPVYFQLRFREIISVVEGLLNDPIKSVALDSTLKENDDTSLLLPGTITISQAFDKCWADNVFLFVLSDKFWKLTLQLLRRYNIWTTNVIEHIVEQQQNDKVDNNNSSSSNNSNGDIKTTEEKLMVILSKDIDNFIITTKSKISNMIFPKLSNDIQDISLLKDSMDEILQDIEASTGQELNRRITGFISKRCMESLVLLVRGISRQYRHTNKPPPTEPSYFIPNIFKPFKHFIEKYRPWINETKEKTWAVMIIDIVIIKYTLIVNDVLSTLIEQDDALKKRKWGKKNGIPKSIFGAFGKEDDSMTDIERIELQFLLDVQQLGNELQELNVDKNQLECYLKLYEVVKPFEHLLTKEPVQ
ncbi:unnamed protein product [Cunninghamella blakesleeana]